MSPRGSITADRVWKRFRADRHRALFRDEVERLLHRNAGGSWRYVLQDVNFHLEPGDSLALVGSNGSGKSTMLKILAGVMFPYAGKVEATGRVGAMIEVAAGIHPELTGRENVHLYGTLLGLPKRRIARRFDDIVAFAGLEQAIDRPVKRYSSGMKMRLGFAVNAFLEPDVLIVDEVLAVGDAEFQRRCLERMREVLDNGTTLLYVSHDLATVEAMCDRAIWLDRGTVRMDGPTREVLRSYRTRDEQRSAELPTGPVTLEKIAVPEHAVSGEPVAVSMVLRSDRPRSVALAVGVSDGSATPIFVVRHHTHLREDLEHLTLELPLLPLAGGVYSLWLSVSHGHDDLIPWQAVEQLVVEGPPLTAAPHGLVRTAPIELPVHWR